MEEPNSSSSALDNGPRSVPPSPPSPSIAFKFTDVKSGVSPKNTRIGANPTSLNAKNALPFERRSPPRKNTTTTIRNAPPPRPSTPPQPHQVINIPTHSTDSPSMTTQVSELSHNSSLRTPTNNATPLTPTTKRPLNSIQQAAMNNFLTAKGKDEKAKAWDELVRSLKQTHRGGGGSVDSRGRRKHRKRTGSSGSVGSCGSHSLGFIQYSRGEDGKMTGGMSVTSGLTSNGTVDITQYYVGGRGGNGDHKPPLFPVITTTTTTATSNLKDAMGGDGGDGVDELVSPLSDNEYCDDDYDDTPEQEEHEEEEENGVSRALLNVDDAEEELAVYEDEEEEDVSALKGVTLFDSMTSIHGLDEEVIAAEVAPLPPPPFSTTDMPKLQPPKGENENRQSVRDMIGRYEANVGAEEEEEEAESWSPSMIRRKNDQLFSSPEQQPQERKQYQFYPEWQKESVESRPAVVFTTTTTAAAATTEVTPAAAAATEATPPAAAAAAIEIPTQRSRKPRKKRFINGTGSGNKSSSLEHQIRLVLGNSSNDDDSKDKGPVEKASASDILRELNSSHDHDDSRDEGQSNDNASASDILRELNSSKEQQHQQQKPLRSSPNSGNKLPPPSSIFFGSKNKQHQKQWISKQSSVATNNGVNTSKKTPALLAPSRRDLHSLRIRQMVSKSTMMANDKVVDDGGAQIEKAIPAPSIATTSTATTNTNTTTTRESSVRPIRGGKGFFTRTGPSSSGLYFSDMITRDETANNNNNKNFDLYHPGRPSNTTVQPITAPQEAYALSSPPRDVTPEKPGSPTNSLAESINELKASISELKSAGVGGVGKSTSTLVWNESTGRYVIRDVDDESFDDMVSKGSKGPTVMQESDEEEEEEEDPTLMFNTSNHITRGSILDDYVVDKAVRLAAVENMSSASTSVGAASADESLNHFLSSPGEEEEEDDFFVVNRSNQNAADGDNGWSAFQQSSENDAFQLNSWGDNGDDGFGDDFGDDASFPSEIQWGANDWTDWEVDDAASKQFGKMNNFGSNRHDPFNPFAQLVLSLD